ncbi:MAG: hypothetical protein Q7J29_15550 [Stagnimonas sp.]|nr:hypothetical protein [Stagnimonas sp.]
MSPEIKHLSDLMAAQSKIFERLLNQSKKQTEILQVMLSPDQKKKLDALRLAAAEKAAVAAKTKAALIVKKPPALVVKKPPAPALAKPKR